MWWNRSAADIAVAWTAAIETEIEAGATPVLDAGAPSLVFDGALTLAAHETLVAQRSDISTPLVLGGGAGALWLALLQQPLGGRGAPESHVIYTGVDPATVLAGVATAHGGEAARRAVAAAIPPELAQWFAPRLNPGAATPWEALPFVECGERPRVSPVGSPPAPDASADWTAWGAMLLALCLVLSALLI
jgi:hypothetical protein